ncbi:MAG: rhodanese-like domain-containing protein [Bacteroidaceae bacterium]|nr:rhodanese-like domain-containing protein [Bacteroidaceae bacterium]MBR5891548.1 rhodanese-like domain-containing protein [Bacteroidaceae bacterium]
MKKIFTRIAMFFACIVFAGCGAANGDRSVTDKILEVGEYVQALQADENAFLLDVRRADEYAQGYIPGATLLDVTDAESFAQGIEKLDKEKTIYIYCRSGRRSRMAAQQLTAKGFNVVDLKGGYNAWKEYTNK